jgi:hypothetical protein
MLQLKSRSRLFEQPLNSEIANSMGNGNSSYYPIGCRRPGVHMRIESLTAAIFALGAFLPDVGQTADRLPFPDGRYVTDPELCSISEQAIVDRFTDATSLYVRYIKGRQIHDGYDVTCETTSVTQKGSDVTFKAICESEGEIEKIDGRYIAIAKDAFALRGSVFRRCGSKSAAATASAQETPGGVTGSFPLASCKGWSGTATSQTGIDSKSAKMTGTITRADIQEYCERDPGGETTQFGGSITPEQCTSKYFAEAKGAELNVVANCMTGALTLNDEGEQKRVKFPLATDADTSCASGMPPLIAQFKTLCPTSAKRWSVE